MSTRIRLTVEIDTTETKDKFDVQALSNIIDLWGRDGLVFLSSEILETTDAGYKHHLMREMINQRDGFLKLAKN